MVADKGKVLILGGGADQVPLVEELGRRGYFTMILDYTDDPPAGAVADRHYRDSSWDEAVALQIAGTEKVAFVTSLANDPVLPVIASVSAQLGLPTPLCPAGAQASTNKAHMRAAFEQAGVCAPFTQVLIRPEEVEDVRLPVVVKPVRGTSSKGVLRVNDQDRLRTLVEASAAAGGLIVQQHIQGIEISVDGFVVDGETHVILTSQLLQVPGLPEGFAIMAMRCPPPLSDEARAQVVEQAGRVARAFGLRNGPFFYQAKVEGDRVYVLEGSARIGGGQKYKTIRTITGFDILGAQIDALEGQAVQPDNHAVDGTFLQLFLYGHSGRVGRLHLPSHPQLIHAQAYRHAGDVHETGTAARDRICSLTVATPTKAEMPVAIRIIVKNIEFISANGEDLLRRDLLNDLLTGSFPLPDGH